MVLCRLGRGGREMVDIELLVVVGDGNRYSVFACVRRVSYKT